MKKVPFFASRSKTTIGLTLAGILGLGSAGMQGCGAAMQGLSAYSKSVRAAQALNLAGQAVTAYEVAEMDAKGRKDAARIQALAAYSKSAQVRADEAAKVAEAAKLKAKEMRDAADILSNQNKYNLKEEYSAFTCTSWKDFNGDGNIDQLEYIGKGKDQIKPGGTLYFVLFAKGKRLQNANVKINFLDEEGTINDSYTFRDWNFKTTTPIMTYNLNDDIGSIAATAATGNVEIGTTQTATWYVNERHVGTVYFRIVED